MFVTQFTPLFVSKFFTFSIFIIYYKYNYVNSVLILTIIATLFGRLNGERKKSGQLI